MTAPLPTTRVETSVGVVRVARDGPLTGDPIVLVHGYPDNLQIWAKVFRSLAERHPVVAFDWPGLGRSDDLVAGATPFHLGRQFIAVLDALEIDAAVPVGFDMGAHAVVAAAVAAPERVSRLVLTDFLGRGDLRTSWDIDVMRRMRLNGVILRRMGSVVFRRAETTFLRSGPPLSPEIRDDMYDSFRRPPVRARLAKMCAGYQGSLRRIAALYPQLDLPTLVLWADSDPHFPRHQGQAVADAIPGAELELIEGASHWFMWSHPDRVADSLLRFVGGEG